MSELEVVHPGVLSQVQDLGRFGVARAGLSQGGAMDLNAFCWGNHLLGNPIGAPQVELTLGRSVFMAHRDMLCVLTGADMHGRIGDRAIEPWQTFILRAGQQLSLGYARHGLRAYLAVEGGFEIEPVLGSCATVTRNQLGGLADGEPLQAGDRLAVGDGHGQKAGRSVPWRYIPDYSQPLKLRVIESYQQTLFTDEEKQSFYGGEYRVSQASDRMGCRLQGPEVSAEVGGIISEAIELGAIQFPANGQPIILLSDRQTLGGYPKLGCVARVDLPALAQAKPGDSIRFVKGDLTELRRQWCEFSRFFGLPF
ncbi:5-oxoprolinase subunit C family protein [Dongshaea marina]|uniref:5-oxoprolinase subunit C family protein n=1 Tax=Dongshaea marina TaxID=2047966 RepID=UPI000D3E1493|nr:biotin-dependent carboxyltransferase family protein [Dongshaea marina]